MNNLKITNNQIFMGKEIPVIYGGFGQDQKCILAKTVSEIHETRLDKINSLINNNLSRFKENIDLIDLKFLNLPEIKEIYSQNALNRSSNIYLLSEKGYTKLVSMMNNANDKKWEIMDKLIDEYFAMKEQLQNPQLKVPQTFKEALLLAVEQQEQIEQLQLKITEDEPKVSYYDLILKNKKLLSTTQIAKDYGMSPQKFNKLLHDLRIQYKISGQWILYSEYENMGYVQSDTILDRNLIVRMLTKWTQKGRIFLYKFLKEKEIVPLIEKNNINI